MEIRDNDTIAAIATPVGEGAIAVIRVSGPEAVKIADVVFDGKKRLHEVDANTVHFGRIVDTKGELVDEVLASVFRAPHSYTGEDSVEISCHGGVYVANQVLEAVLAAGARQADPGEYTRRAFLSGRIDLSQGEAVADLISARSQKAHWASVVQLEGRLSGFVTALRADLLHLCSLLEIELDFSEEGLPIVDKAVVREQLARVNGALSRLIESYRVGRHFRDGVSVVLVGKPNAGKSSLFNALLKENRAIVSPSPGTTRDYIEEAVVLGGILFRLVDTAGLRESAESVEADGVRRSRRLATQSDIVVVVVDCTESRSRVEAVSSVEGLVPAEKLIIAYNKIDLFPSLLPGSTEFSVEGIKGCEVYLSAKTGDGIAILTHCLMRSVSADSSDGSVDFRITSRRHVNACKRASECLGRGLESLNANLPNELIALDIRQASDSLAEITGEITSDDVLNEIFQKFCIGK